MKTIIKAEQLLTRILETIIVLCFLCILLLIITLVILRYAFNTTIVGGNEFVVILFIYTSALGAAVIVGKNEHIAITWFIDKLPRTARSVVDIFDYVLIAFINGAMLWHSISWIGTTGANLSAILRIPQYYAQIVVPIGCAAAILYCLFNILMTFSHNQPIESSD